MDIYKVRTLKSSIDRSENKEILFNNPIAGMFRADIIYQMKIISSSLQSAIKI